MALRELVQDALLRRSSPEQIAGRLRRQFPDDPEMWVSAETIYQSLYVQSRGALRCELDRCLRTGRALREPGRHAGQRRSRIVRDMVNISQRPPEAADRAVPGHWEGDLMIGRRNASAIATLVERATGLRDARRAARRLQARHVAPALAKKIQTLPEGCVARSHVTAARLPAATSVAASTERTTTVAPSEVAGRTLGRHGTKPSLDMRGGVRSLGGGQPRAWR